MSSCNGYDPQVEELYTMAAKWDGVAAAVPDVISRLTALKHIHEQGIPCGGDGGGSTCGLYPIFPPFGSSPFRFRRFCQ